MTSPISNLRSDHPVRLLYTEPLVHPHFERIQLPTSARDLLCALRHVFDALAGSLPSPPQLLKLEKLLFMLPVTTRTNKYRQGLNLYGCFLQNLYEKMVGYVPSGTVLTSHLKPTFFMKRRKGFGIQGIRLII